MKSFVSQRNVIVVQLLMVFIGMLVLLTLLMSPRLIVQVEIDRIDKNGAGNEIRFQGPFRSNLTIQLRNLYKALSVEESIEAKSVLDKRRSHLNTFCKFIGNEKSLSESSFPNIIIDTAHGISWCPVYKAASSTWMRHFASLAGVLSDDIVDLIRQNLLQLNAIVRQTFPRDSDTNETLKKLEKTKKFLIVRHPHERLLSAYRDKLEHIAGREYYYKRFGRRIVQKYRREEDRNGTRLEPTFAEFLRFIVAEKYFDEHWAPFYSTCRPCAINYDYILKFETLTRDERFFIHENGLQNYLDQIGDMRNNNPNGITDHLMVRDYLKDVPLSLLQKVNEIYKKDFMLFSYSPREYLSDQNRSKD